MSSHLIIVDKSSSFKFDRTDLEVLTTKDYIARPELVRTRNPKIVNLSRAYSYLGAGYYCSLLAEARSHKVIPSVKTILDLSQKSIYRYALAELEELLKRRLHKMAQPPEASFTLYSFFGSADDRRFQDLTRRTFDLFRCPMLKIQIRLKDDWHIHSLQPLSLDDLRDDQEDHFRAALDAYTKTSWREPTEKPAPRYTMAILYNPKEALPPSSPKSLQKFIKAGERLGITMELVEKKDYLRLAEYDGLFIRENTSLDDHTYRFAKKAEKEGMVGDRRPQLDPQMHQQGLSGGTAEGQQACRRPRPSSSTADKISLGRAGSPPHRAQDPGRLLLARRLQGAEPGRAGG